VEEHEIQGLFRFLYRRERDCDSNRPVRWTNAAMGAVDVFYRLTSNGIGAHYDYAPFGAGTRTHGDSSVSFDIVSLNPFRFSSEYHDSELDLVYYNFRHYSPSLGRFLSRDPIAEQGGLNLYAFVRNNPNVFFDERGGAVAIAIGGGFGIGVGIGAGILVGIGIGIVVGIVAIGVISIIDSIPTSDAQVEENTEEKTDAVPIDKCEPCNPRRQCPDDVYNRLKKAVDDAKEVVAKLGKCRKTDSCSLLQDKIFAWQNEIVARENMMNQCFDGGTKAIATSCRMFAARKIIALLFLQHNAGVKGRF